MPLSRLPPDCGTHKAQCRAAAAMQSRDATSGWHGLALGASEWAICPCVRVLVFVCGNLGRTKKAVMLAHRVKAVQSMQTGVRGAQGRRIVLQRASKRCRNQQPHRACMRVLLVATARGLARAAWLVCLILQLAHARGGAGSKRHACSILPGLVGVPRTQVARLRPPEGGTR